MRFRLRTLAPAIGVITLAVTSVGFAPRPEEYYLSTTSYETVVPTSYVVSPASTVIPSSVLVPTTVTRTSYVDTIVPTGYYVPVRYVRPRRLLERSYIVSPTVYLAPTTFVSPTRYLSATSYVVPTNYVVRPRSYVVSPTSYYLAPTSYLLATTVMDRSTDACCAGTVVAQASPRNAEASSAETGNGGGNVVRVPDPKETAAKVPPPKTLSSSPVTGVQGSGEAAGSRTADPSRLDSNPPVAPAVPDPAPVAQPNPRLNPAPAATPPAGTPPAAPSIPDPATAIPNPASSNRANPSYDAIPELPSKPKDSLPRTNPPAGSPGPGTSPAPKPAPTAAPKPANPGADPSLLPGVNPLPDPGAIPNLPDPDAKAPPPLDPSARVDPTTRRTVARPVYQDQPRPKNILQGRVVSAETGVPEEGVTVMIVHKLGAFTERSVQTDALGRFAVTLPDGDWVVKVGMPSGRFFAVGRSDFTASAGEITDADGNDMSSVKIKR